MRRLYALKDMLSDELMSYADKGKLDMQSLEVVDKLAHACKNICKIIEACEEESGYSNRRMPNFSYGDWNVPGMSYGGSYAKRDSMGRYSRHGDFRMEFQNLLNEAPNERIRQKMMECMNEM